MTTIDQLIAIGELKLLDVELGFGEFADRKIYGCKRFIEWHDGYEDLPPTAEFATTPLSALEALMEEFIKGRKMIEPKELHWMEHVDGIIWVLKTHYLRVYGAFSEVDTFIAYKGYEKGQVAELNLYKPICDEAVMYFRSIGLEPNQFIKSKELRHVISN